MNQKIAVIGECMLELCQNDKGALCATNQVALSYGGDTLNVAVYLARLNCSVDYVTALGDDSLSRWMLQQWRTEGVGCELVQCFSDSVPGLYFIETDEFGERSFLYWRDNSPASRLFEDHELAEQLFARMMNYEWLYLSGISLSIYSEQVRQKLFAFMEQYRNQGGKIIFDSNYRPAQWNDEMLARETIERMYRLTDFALPTLEDEKQLFGDHSSDAIMRRIRSWGPQEVILKMGEEGCLIGYDNVIIKVEALPVDVVNTTAAGDSFNAGYMSARIAKSNREKAAQMGHRLASMVIQHQGAIISKALMPDMSEIVET